MNDDFICLSDICQKQSDFIEYRERKSENKINFYHKTEVIKIIGDKTLKEVVYLPLKAIRDTYNTEEKYTLPAGIYFGEEKKEEFFKTLREDTRKKAIENMIKMSEDRLLFQKPQIEKLIMISFQHNNVDDLTKYYISEVIKLAEEAHQASKDPNFDRSKAIIKIAEIIADFTVERTQKRVEFYENDSDCQELVQHCEKDACFTVGTWDPNMDLPKIHAKTLYIKRTDKIKNYSITNKKGKHGTKDKDIRSILNLIHKLSSTRESEGYTFLDVANTPEKLCKIFMEAIFDPNKAAWKFRYKNQKGHSTAVKILTENEAYIRFRQHHVEIFADGSEDLRDCQLEPIKNSCNSWFREKYPSQQIDQ